MLLTDETGLLGFGESLVSSVFSTSATGPNRDAAAAVFPLAAAGNLAAVQAFRSRATIQTVDSAQPWKDGLARLPAALQQAAQAAVDAGSIPASWWQLTPAQVLPTVQGYHVQAPSSYTLAPVPVGSVTAAPSNIITQLLDLAGLGPKGQQQLAQTAGQTAGQQIGRYVLLAVVVMIVVLVVVKLAKR